MGNKYSVKIGVEGKQITVETDMVFVKGIKVKGDEKTDQWVFAANIHRERPVSCIYLYKHRWAIETKFRVADELRIKTKTTDIGKGFSFPSLLYCSTMFGSVSIT